MSQKTVYRYRSFCQTENAYVYGWDTAPPTTCPNNTLHTIDTNSIVAVDSVSDSSIHVANLPKTVFDEVRVAERTRIIELKSIFGKSALRDVYVEQGTGTITNNLTDAEYRLAASAANDYIELRSAERGRYVAGLQGEVGLAARLPASLTGNQAIRMGLIDSNNGIYFKYTSTGMSAAVLRDGVETVFPQSEWNKDRFDGTGPSGLSNLDFTRGIIYIIQFTWYGYGSINWYINTIGGYNNTQQSWHVHVFQPLTQTSINNPNLPITVSMGNNGTAAPCTFYVAGRQYALIGKYTPLLRVNSAYRFNVSINSTTNFLPVLSIRRKVGYLGNAIRSFNCDFLATSDMVIQVRVNTTITGASWVNQAETNPADTAAQIDLSATAVTGGIPIWMGLVTGANNSTTANTVELSYNLPEFYILTVCARGVSATNGNIGLVIRWSEEW